MPRADPQSLLWGQNKGTHLKHGNARARCGRPEGWWIANIPAAENLRHGVRLQADKHRCPEAPYSCRGSAESSPGEPQVVTHSHYYYSVENSLLLMCAVLNTAARLLNACKKYLCMHRYLKTHACKYSFLQIFMLQLSAHVHDDRFRNATAQCSSLPIASSRQFILPWGSKQRHCSEPAYWTTDTAACTSQTGSVACRLSQLKQEVHMHTPAWRPNLPHQSGGLGWQTAGLWDPCACRSFCISAEVIFRPSGRTMVYHNDYTCPKLCSNVQALQWFLHYTRPTHPGACVANAVIPASGSSGPAKAMTMLPIGMSGNLSMLWLPAL